MTIAANLKHWRQVRGLTQPELAERAEIEQGYLSKLENGRSSPSDAVRGRLAEALGIDVETLERDPSANGQVRRNVMLALAILAVLGVGFAAGYLASGYEVRKVNHEGARLETIWSLAPPGIVIENLAFSDARDGASPGVQLVGNYEDPEMVREYARRLLDSGLLGTELSMLSISQNARRGFVIFFKGERALPVEDQPVQ